MGAASSVDHPLRASVAQISPELIEAYDGCDGEKQAAIRELVLGVVAPPLPAKLYYWKIKGALAPTCLLLSMAEKRVETTFFASRDEWRAFRDEAPGRFPTGQLPALEYGDGKIVPESGACKRAVAAALGRLGAGRDFAVSESLMGQSDDLKRLLNKTAPTLLTLGLMGAAKTWTPDSTAACEAARPDVEAAIGRAANMLDGAGDRFTAGGESCGEVDMWWTLHCVDAVHGAGALGPLQPFYDRLRAHPGVAAYVDGTSAYSTPETPMWHQPIPDRIRRGSLEAELAAKCGESKVV